MKPKYIIFPVAILASVWMGWAMNLLFAGCWLMGSLGGALCGWAGKSLADDNQDWPWSDRFVSQNHPSRIPSRKGR